MERVLAVRFYAAKQPLKLETVQISAPRDDEVLVDIKAATICHSDLHTIAGRQVPATIPITLGHEASGIVESRGRNATSVQVGDRVGIDYVQSCDRCRTALGEKTTSAIASA